MLVPRLAYRGKMLAFVGSLVGTIALLIVWEEFVLEPWMYPGTRRAEGFPGVFFTLIDVLPVILILAGGKSGWDAYHRMREVESLKTAVRESELQYLQSQINPHFLFNNLNNLYSYAVERSARMPDMILQLADVLRYMLYECRERYVPLGKEVQHLENFVRISELQIEERGRVRFTTEGIRPGYHIAPLILNVFVENAFKHSTNSMTNGIEIDISLRLTDGGTLEFSCENTYHPQSNSDRLDHGIGLANVKKRLAYLHPDAHRLTIAPDPARGRYRVELEINALELDGMASVATSDSIPQLSTTT